MNDMTTEISDRGLAEQMLHRADCLAGAAAALRHAANTVLALLTGVALPTPGESARATQGRNGRDAVERVPARVETPAQGNAGLRRPVKRGDQALVDFMRSKGGFCTRDVLEVGLGRRGAALGNLLQRAKRGGWVEKRGRGSWALVEGKSSHGSTESRPPGKRTEYDTLKAQLGLVTKGPVEEARPDLLEEKRRREREEEGN